MDRFRSDSDASTAVVEIVLERMTGKQYLGTATRESLQAAASLDKSLVS